MDLLVGDDRIALSGLSGPVSTHRHATAAVIVALEHPLQLLADGRSRELGAALLAPGFEHAIDLRGGSMAVFLLPPQRVRERVTELEAGAWLELARHVDRLEHFEPVDRALQPRRPLDARLAAAIEVMTARLDENVPVEEVAADVRLSPTRLMTLAREQLGTSLRGYRRWLRTFQVAREYAGGASLTEAALEAGFSSSAHLSAAARDHFGIMPSQVLSPANRTRIVALQCP